jgi:hypothetical protein
MILEELQSYFGKLPWKRLVLFFNDFVAARLVRHGADIVNGMAKALKVAVLLSATHLRTWN